MTGASKVKVAVRLRPLNRREVDLGAEVVVDMQSTQTFLKPPKSERKTPKTFAYDHCFWSVDEAQEKFANQEYVFTCLGVGVVENAFDGYNACIFAYGQTGSGKSYTMMGTPTQKGLIPRICDDMFERIARMHNEDPNTTHKVEVSYMEIYNEKVRDLLCPKSDKQNLKVREHKVLGPYVDGLSKLVVGSYSDINNLMSEGNKSRTVAATMMNAESSRSHAVFNVVLTQSQYDPQTESTGEKVSKLSLVDLAGSERVSKTGAAGDRLKEGGNINKSLSTLGLVISSLADQAGGKAKKGSFVPYRDSVLTWLLKDNLGGNSKTVMVATISPAADNYEETLSTLRYADRAKRIENHAVVNEDPNAKIIRELRSEVDRLRAILEENALSLKTARKSGRESDETGDIKEKLEESEKLMQECTLTWEEKEKQTELIHQERHRILEEMGISIQDSGIGVKEGRYYVVNLNADPSLNELLVYYLKDHTRIGRRDAPTPQDIQLSGLGILMEHCVIDIEDDVVYIQPSHEARTCVNGQLITERTQLRHGDRILWGNNHFFRLSCPYSSNTTQELDQTVDFDFAQSELLLNEFDTLGVPTSASKRMQGSSILTKEPIKNIIKQLEEHHEKEKQGALEEQRKQYEEEIEKLRRSTPLGTPAEMSSYNEMPSYMDSRMSLPTSGYGSRMSDNSYIPEDRYSSSPVDREMAYEESLRRLREEVLKANAYVREANQISEEMKKGIEFAVTLQIPAASLSRGRNRAPLASEVAVVVKDKSRGTQVWSVEKLKNKIYGMRDIYQQTIVEAHPLQESRSVADDDSLFFEVECHTLIGVATVWLECLFENVPLDYAAPIISQQGEVCGKLAVEIRRLTEDNGSFSSEDSYDEDSEHVQSTRTTKVQVTIQEAVGLPPVLCNYVFCQYSFYDQPLTVVPPMNANTSPAGTKTNAMIFEHSQVFTVDINDDFLEYISDGSLPIEVYGNRSRGFDSPSRLSWNTGLEQDPNRSPSDRWRELMRKVEMWVEIQELNEQGTYSPVELQTRDGSECGGMFQLRQGYARRIVVKMNVPKQGQLPVVVERITGISIGSVNVRAKIQKGLDTYQEKDLQRLRDKWSSSLLKRREYLDQQIQDLINKPDKTPSDKERESVLIDQWVSLTEERNMVLCPAPGSGVPGAPMEWNPAPGMESHISVIFLDLDETVLGGVSSVEPETAGVSSVLQFEQPERIIDLSIIRYDQQRVSAVASWDSSIHDSVYLNRVTQNNERIYLILKVTVRLCSPVVMNLILRKRICVRIYKKQSIKESLKKRFLRPTNSLTRCAATYELVSHIPRQAGEETEERQNLARKAADAIRAEDELVDGDVIEKYNRGISHVENILNLHKLRQKVLLEEKLAASGRSSKSLRKFASTPNLAHITSASNSDISDGENRRASSDVPPRNSLTPELSSSSKEARSRENIDNIFLIYSKPGSTSPAEVVPRRNRASPKPNLARHSFYGFDNVGLIQTGEIDINSGSPKMSSPLTKEFRPSNIGSLSSTPRSTGGLQPLIEIDSPASPNKTLRTPENDTHIIRSASDSFFTKTSVARSLENKFSAASIDERQPDDESLSDKIDSNNTDSNDNELNIDIDNKSSSSEELEGKAGITFDASSSSQGAVKEEKSAIRTNSNGNETDSETMTDIGLKVDDVVNMGPGKDGTVRFIGKTQFADGIWVGLELSVPEGKNDGSVKGISYFTCEPNHGLFIRADKLTRA